MMQDTLDLELGDLANLALQRTGRLFAIGGRNAFNTWIESGDKAPIERFLSAKDKAHAMIEGILADIAGELSQLLPLISEPPSRLASIGPGMCFYELLLYEAWRPARMYLIDIEHTAEHHQGMNKTGSGYNENEAARKFLLKNGVAPAAIHFANPRNEQLDLSPVDLIVSNLSMGFHYPCNEYVDYIKTALPAGGHLIFDRRHGADDSGWEVLSPYFSHIGAITHKKREKVVFRRNV